MSCLPVFLSWVYEILHRENRVDTLQSDKRTWMVGQAKRDQQTFPSMSTLERYRRFVWNLWQRSRPDAISNKRSAREHENSQKIGQLVEVGISRITGDKRSQTRTEQRDQILLRSDLVLNPTADLDLTSDRNHYIGNHSMILYLNDYFVCWICP